MAIQRKKRWLLVLEVEDKPRLHENETFHDVDDWQRTLDTIDLNAGVSIKRTMIAEVK